MIILGFDVIIFIVIGSIMEDFMKEEIYFQSEIYFNFLQQYNNSKALKYIETISCDEFWFTGSGDSHCASLFGSSSFNQLGISARDFKPMDLSNYFQSKVKNPCLIAISVSGKTPRVLEVIKKFKHNYPNAPVIGLTDNPESPLFKDATHSILIGASPPEVLATSEYSDEVAKQYTGYHHDIAQTKSYFANILWIIGLAIKISQPETNVIDALVDNQKNLKSWIEFTENWTRNTRLQYPKKTIFIGSGLFHSLAQFGQYKWFEFTFPGLNQDLEEYAHTHYFTTDMQTSLIFFGPFGNHLKRFEELFNGALQPLIKPEMFLLTESGSSNLLSTEGLNILPLPSVSLKLPIIWREILYYLFSLVFIEWLAYSTARNAGLNTNTFRGGKEGDKYVRGSFNTIRKSKIETQ